MACDTNNQPPSDTDHQKYTVSVGAGDIFAAKLDYLVDFMCIFWQRRAYGSK